MTRRGADAPGEVEAGTNALGPLPDSILTDTLRRRECSGVPWIRVAVLLVR